jgi:hypothetical protein
MRLFALVALTILLSTGNLCSQVPNFIQERIDVFVHKDYAEIEGIYYFYNPHTTPTQNSFYYPFVLNENLKYPDSISAAYLKTGEKINFRKSKSGIHFVLSIAPGDTCIYKVYYRQKVKTSQMEYILTTTKQWRKPLSYAEYYIHLSSNLQLKDSSYKFDLVGETASSKTYFLKKKNFMPDKNLVVSWRVK